MAKAVSAHELLSATDTFVRRHLGLTEDEVSEMLDTVGCRSLEQLIDQIIPKSIRMQGALDIGPPRGEHELLQELHDVVQDNQPLKSFIGMGYHGCIVPPVIQRNVLENPGWYTAYTPYQAEIAQGRLEVLLAFQTMVSDLVGLPLCNASLLDEATAAAEAMALCHRIGRGKRNTFFVADNCHPQTITVVQGRAEALGIEIVVGAPDAVDDAGGDLFGALLQYPDTAGRVTDLGPVIERVHHAGALAVVATDLLASTLLRPAGELGADVAVGGAQRFGVPMGYGGPHAAFLATKTQYKRQVPGRVIGVSRDGRGRPALRMAMQTREQHIRREKATSNICTAQVLLAVMAALYGVYHGREGLTAIARKVHGAANLLAGGLNELGLDTGDHAFFDTVAVELGKQDADTVLARARDRGYNLRRLHDHGISIALDETVEHEDIEALLEVFAGEADAPGLGELSTAGVTELPEPHRRTSAFMTHPVFARHRTEHELLRYLHRLESRDLSLTTSMIPLGSCTMKLNATSEMLPVTWPELASLHPFVPPEQARGYQCMMEQLERWLADITGFHAISLQPNAGAQGEYAGLLVIRAYHRSRGQETRDVCLIPVSAHGTNPASAVMAGMDVVTVACDDHGNVDLDDLRAKAKEHQDRLAALMVTYPSTHGVFESSIRELCDIVHEHGGQVYLDGANMNAQVGLCRPGDYGADVCHLNLHKTFCIPHGGGGPGMGPIGVAKHLTPFLPGHPVVPTGGSDAIAAIAAAPWGSASILPISWMYIGLMGSEGLAEASRVAILNANYMAKRLEDHYPVLYRGTEGRVAHEFILDLRPFKRAGIEAEDVAKRLIDYGFHAPTMSFPVAGTLMIEPTESESKAELDRLCDALISIREEIRAVESGDIDAQDNPLKNAPHTADMVMADEWSHPYSRQQAAFPAPWLQAHKFWPFVGRIDNAWGDRHLQARCPDPEQ